MLAGMRADWRDGVNQPVLNDPAVDVVLQSVGLGHLAGRFAEEDIDGTVLWSLRDDDLREMGLTLGQRKKLLERLKSGSEPPATATAEPELRRLTVLFSDLVGFTELATRLDPDEMRAILQAYYAAARDAARTFGGFIASLQGDGVVVLFGFPVTRGGSADRAIGAAQALLADLRGMLHHLPDGRDIGLAARIGIASGRAIVGYPDGATGAEPQMVGPVINRAARLQGIARPGSVVVDDPTRTLATGAFAFARLPDANLKGFEHPVPVSEATVATGSALALATPGAPVGTFVRSAHTSEAAALARAWDDAKARQSRLVLLSGDPGIGKSTLLRQAVGQAMDEGACVLRLRCAALSAHVPLHPVVDLLEGMLGDASQSSTAVRLQALRHLLAPAPSDEFIAVAELLGLARPVPGRMTTPAEERNLLFAALTRFLLRTRPCLIAVEDLHWADATTREVLCTCAGAAPDKGVMILATSRDGDDPLWQGQPDHLHLPLAPLGQQAAAGVLSHHLDGRLLPEAILQTMLARSSGNPLMLEVMARTVEGWQGSGAGQDVQVPASIYESIAARLETLTVGRKTASALSVFDAPTDAPTLAQALGVEPQALDDAVAELVACGVCESRDGTLQFRHNLYREVCYERLVKSARENLHLAVFAALSARVPQIGTDRPGLLALHAHEGGDHARAAPLAFAAAEQAMQRSAVIEAGHFLHQATVSLDRTARTRSSDLLRLRVLVTQASVSRARHGIANDEAGVLGRKVLDLARHLGESRSEMIALSGLYAHALVWGDYPGAKEWAERLGETAMASQDPTFAMIGTRAQGVVAFHTGALAEAAVLLQQALDSYDEARHLPLTFAQGYDHAEICAVFLSFCLWIKGDPVGAERTSAFSISHSRRIGHAHSLTQALMFRALLMALAGEGSAAETAAREARELSGKHGLGAFHGASSYLVEIGHLMARTDVPTTADLASLCKRHDAFMQANQWNYRPLSGAMLAQAHLAAGDVSMAEATLNEADAVQTRIGEFFVRPELMRVRASILAARGDTDAAEAALQAAFEAATDMGAGMLALRIACDLAEAWPSPGAIKRLVAVRGRLVSEDGGRDLLRCQALLSAAGLS